MAGPVVGLLREAAQRMRIHARRVAPVSGSWRVTEGKPSHSVRTEAGWEICWADDLATLDHIASWHPEVALAVAEMLDGSAARYAAEYGEESSVVTEDVAGAVHIADAYLGRAS